MQEPNHKWSDLLLKYLANNISGSELEELHRQIATSDWKKEAFLRVSDPQYFIQALKEHYNIDTKKGWAKLTKANPAFKIPVVIPVYKRPWVIIAAAAAVIVVAIGIKVWVFTPNENVNYSYVKSEKSKMVNIDIAENGTVLDFCFTHVKKNGDTIEIINKTEGKFKCPNLVMSTAPGKMWVLKYSDGSISHLNASTTIQAEGFNNYMRHVDILAGECEFEVVKNNMAPFTVSVRDMTIQTIGTKFNVSAYKDAPVTTTLIEGKIKVSVGEKQFLLDSAQQARYSKNKFESVANVNLEQVQAWTQHFFDFRDLSVEQTMKEIGAWYGYEIIVKAKLTKVTYISTINRSLPMMDVFEALVPNFKITTSGKKIYITDPD